MTGLGVTKNDVWDARLDTSQDEPIPTLDFLRELGRRDDWPPPGYARMIWPDGSFTTEQVSWTSPYSNPRACATVILGEPSEVSSRRPPSRRPWRTVMQATRVEGFSDETGYPLALRMEGVSKRYPGTLAVDRVDFDVRVGEVHAIMGENGAGKCRSIPRQLVERATATVLLFAAVVALALTLLLIVEHTLASPHRQEPLFLDSAFEIVSALCTVGLSTGVTDSLSLPGRAIVIVLMFAGRLGPITVFAVLARPLQERAIRYAPQEPLIG